MARETFVIIAVTKISDNKELVLSKNSKNEFVLATRLVVMERDRPKYYYDKGAIIVDQKYSDDFKQFVDTASL